MLNNQTTKTRQLTKKEYKQLRKTSVQNVYKSENHTIMDIAAQLNIGASTLWGWCQQDLGPRQLKKVKRLSNALRGTRNSKAHQEKKRITNATNMNTMAKVALLKTKGLQVPTNLIPHKNKPWDLKKAKLNSPEHQATTQAAYDAISYDNTIKKITLPVHRKTTGPHISINLDPNGKLVNYEVTGDINVTIFTQTEHTTNLSK